MHRPYLALIAQILLAAAVCADDRPAIPSKRPREAVVVALKPADIPDRVALPRPAAPPTLAIVSRTIDRGPGPWQGWRVDYTLRNDTTAALSAEPSAVSATIRGWVSNSRVAAHAVPLFSTLQIEGATGLTARAELIPSADADRRCRETSTLQVWAGGAESAGPARPGARPTPVEDQPTVVVAPGGTLRARLSLEHEHFLYGAHDPLLGVRQVELRLGAATLRDSLPLDRPAPAAAVDPSWPCGATADRLDRACKLDGRESLHLEAAAGCHTHRFPERAVRYATRYRLTYWYRLAPGTEGGLRARTAQLREGSIWKSLADGDHVQVHPDGTAGRWRRVERTFRTEPDATTLLLEFGLPGDVGEAWVAGVRLEPVEGGQAGP